MSDAEIESLTQVLKLLLRFSKIQNRDIEKQLGFSGGYMSRLLSGKIDIKISHILALTKILGLHPHELFALAFPQTGKGPSPGLQHVQKVLPHLVPASLGAPASAEAAAPDLAALHQRLEAGFGEVLRRVFKELEIKQ